MFNLTTLYKLNHVLKTAFEKHNFPSFNKKAHLKYCRMELKTFKLACTHATKIFLFFVIHVAAKETSWKIISSSFQVLEEEKNH